MRSSSRGAAQRQGAGERSKSNGRSGRAGTKPAAAGAKSGAARKPGDPRRRTSSDDPDPELSPRLLAQGQGVPHGAPLLREPGPPPDADDRFCTQGPIMTCPGMSTRRSTGPHVLLAFPELIIFVDRSVGQASMFLNDRLRLLEMRLKQAPLPAASRRELCEIADGVCAAAYHAQKWAHLLRPDEFRQPFKPSGCDDAAMALALMHHATPRLMVGASEAKKAMSAALAQHGDKAEARVNKAGVPTADLRALAPHIESLVGRIGRLSNKLRPENMKVFVLGYFTPALGPEPTKRLLLMLGLAAPVQAW